MRIFAPNTCALLVDIQERLFPHIYENDRLAANVTKLIQGLQVLQIPVIATEQYTRGLGITIEPLRSLFTDWQPIEKISFSCADSEPLLKKIGDKTVIVFGIEAHVCVLQTAIDLRAAGVTVVVVEDCIGSRRESDKITALKRLQAEGVLLTSYESILFELCRFADASAFKPISKIVK